MLRDPGGLRDLSSRRRPRPTGGHAMSRIAGPSALRDRAAYQALEQHAEQLRGQHLRDLFADDPERGTRMTAEAEGLFLDYSKNRVTDETLRLLVELAEESGLRGRIDAMFSGEHINITEDRAVLHVALRAPADAAIHVDGDERRARGPRGARPDGALLRRDPLRRVDRAHRPAHPQRRQHRHRRLRPRPGDGLRGAAPLQRARARPSASSPTSTARTSPRPRATSIPRRRCSSSRPRRSRRSRR